MKNRILQIALLIGLSASIGMQSCKKESTLGWDNDKVVKTPYNVYAGTDDGWLVNTNDGRVFSSVFAPDGSPIKQITSAGTNVLIFKSQLYYSQNDAHNFNPVSFTSYSAQPFSPWIFYSYQQQKTFMATTLGFGVAASDDGGITWAEDDNFVPLTSTNVKVTSFTETNDGKVYAFAPNANTLYRKDNAGAQWTNVVAEGVYPILSDYFLAANGTQLFLTDYNGTGGVWYTSDAGAHWYKFHQGALPNDGSVHYVAAASNSDGTLAVATDHHAYWVSQLGGTFQLADGGLDQDITITGLTSKEIIYKNGNTAVYLFMSTNKGIYRSDDHGMTWDKVTSGNFDVSYRSIY